MNVTQAKSVTGRVLSVIRDGVTKNGNVTRTVVLQVVAIDGVTAVGRTTVRVAKDSSLSGAIENSEYRDEDHTFMLNKSGRITRSEAHDMTCGTCGRTWSSTATPTPAARCPYSYDHKSACEYSVYSITDGVVNEDEHYTDFLHAEAAYHRMVVAERALKKRSERYEATTVTLYDRVRGDIVRTWTATEK